MLLFAFALFKLQIDSLQQVFGHFVKGLYAALRNAVGLRISENQSLIFKHLLEKVQVFVGKRGGHVVEQILQFLESRFRIAD